MTHGADAGAISVFPRGVVLLGLERARPRAPSVEAPNHERNGGLT